MSKSSILCRAKSCLRWAVPGFDLCDPHLEAEEEGAKVQRVAAYRPETKPRPDRSTEVKQRVGPSISNLPAKERREALRQAVREIQAERMGRKP